MDLSILLQSYFSQKSRPAKKPGSSAAFLFLHQTDAVVIRLGGDEGLVLLEDVVHEGDDGVVALRHGLFEGIVVISRTPPYSNFRLGPDPKPEIRLLRIMRQARFLRTLTALNQEDKKPDNIRLLNQYLRFLAASAFFFLLTLGFS